MYEVTIIDLVLVLPIGLLIPVLVYRYLGEPGFSEQFRGLVIFGGLAWLVLAFFQEDQVYYMLGISRADGAIHWRRAIKAAEQLRQGISPFGPGIPVGNQAYVLFLATLRLIGASSNTAVVINGMLAFAGGLALVRAINRVFPLGRGREFWFTLVIFFPSTVFWTTSNMKEGFMYWAICQMVAPVIEAPRNSRSIFSFMSVVGLGVAAFFRPHIAMIWAFSCILASFLSQGRRFWAIGLLLILPLVLVLLNKFVGASLMSPEEALEVMQRQYQGLNDPRAGSHIDFGPGGPIFFISGLTSVLFRPFPWEVSSLRLFISCLETWGLAAILLTAWLTLPGYQLRYLLRMPAVWAALIVVALFSVVFSYLPNEGLMARQRVQMVPALLILALCPFLLRPYAEELARAFAMRRYLLSASRR